MGMFDYMICEYPIDAPPNILEWQTKDCQDAPYLENFKIQNDGTLWHEYKEYETVEDSAAFFGTSIRVKFTEWRQMKGFHGEVRFYGNEYENGRDNYSKWWEYSALFEDGHITSMKRLSPQEIEA